jgi:hypothetical protein
MTRITKAALTIVLTLSLVLVLGLAALAANEQQLHQNATTTAMGKCVACHGNKASSASLSASVATAHKLHMRSSLKTVRFGQCQLCHIAADELNDSGASLRKQVSPVKCLSCHGTFVTSPKDASGNVVLVNGVPAHQGVTVTSTNCLDSGCHNSRAEVRKAHRAAKAPVSAKAARIAYCADCHGGSASVPALFSTEETNPATW